MGRPSKPLTPPAGTGGNVPGKDNGNGNGNGNGKGKN